MTFNPLIFMFCLLTVMNNLVTINGARQLKNISLDGKEVVIGGEKVENQVNPNKNNDMEKTKVYQNQFLPLFPFLDIPGPSFPFPPFQTHIVVDNPNPPFPLVPIPPME
ncbi:unnamed protein product [Trifolium pratense]|uniref:Uncharacterized protein n=1 Tax=Trifolium pratense TaxID=57577 RepID=A0ACB0JNQ4_TRIPR|nr:unnamed protein product [Trifolium pratense]